MTKPNQTIGDRIRAARLAKSRRIHAELVAAGQRIAANESADTMYTQQMLADDAGVTQQQVSSWESGKKEPEIRSLRRLAPALGVTVAHLLGEK